jgi:chaperone required for assembly of F1-ATPase
MADNEEKPRRFYKEAGVKEDGGTFGVALDGRALRTPRKTLMAAPTRALAELAAGEWAAQVEVIRAETMPVTRLINVALDFTPDARSEMAANVARYGETDLLCHRAGHPASLVDRQRKHWDGLLDWAGSALDAPLVCAEGLIAVQQPDASLDALKSHAEALDDFALTALAHATGLSGSAILGFALQRGKIDAQAAFEASALDELHQLEVWGEDEEARARLENLRAELTALERFFAALG